MTSPQEFKPHGKGYLFDHLGMSFSFDPSGVATGLLSLEKHHFPGRVESMQAPFLRWPTPAQDLAA